MRLPEKRIYRFEDVEVNLTSGCLRRGDSKPHLRQKSFQVLIYLLEQRERLVTKNELIENVWKNTAVTDDALVQCIKEVRRAIGDDSHQPKYIKTFPKSGYRFVGTVEEKSNEFHLAEKDFPIKENASPLASISGLFSKKLIFAFSLIVITLISSVFFIKFRQKPVQTFPEIILPQTPGKKSLVVAFFKNQSNNPEIEWLREGIADMLITNLSRSTRNNVLSRQQFHTLLEKNGINTNEEISFEQTIGIARKSRATNFITGSFAKVGDKIRLDAQLYDAQDGTMLTAESLIADKPENILAEIDLLSLKLTKFWESGEPVNPKPMMEIMTDNLEAYRYYSLGVEKAQSLHNKEALEFLKKAVALDPQFAMAQARIGYVYSISWGIAEKGKPFLEKAFQLSERLSEKDRLNITAWYAIANLDFPAAIETYREIIKKYPLETESYWRLGKLLAGEERTEEAIEVFRQGLAIDPEDKNIYNALGNAFSISGRHDEAIAAHRRYIALAPSESNAYDSLGMSFQWAGDYDSAITNFQRALELNPNFEIGLIHLANAYFQVGRYQAAIALHEKYIRIAPSDNERQRGFNGLSFIYRRLKNYKMAERFARQGYSLQKGIPGALFLLSLDRGDLQKAQSLESLIFAKNFNNDRGAKKNQRYEFYNRGFLALKTGQTDTAIENFQNALRHNPPTYDIDSMEDCLANAYLELGKFDEAISEYERILKLNPNYPLARFHLAQAFEQKDLQIEARRNYEIFLETWKDADSQIPEIQFARRKLQSV